MSPSSSPSPGTVGRGRVVQLVEDEMIVNALTAEALTVAGFEVYQAYDGPSGLASVLAHPEIELLVSDVGLPGLNGRQVADAARAKYPNLPVLLVTGYAEQGDISAANLPAGMRVLSKPFDMDTLLEAVLRMIG